MMEQFGEVPLPGPRVRDRAGPRRREDFFAPNEEFAAEKYVPKPYDYDVYFPGMTITKRSLWHTVCGHHIIGALDVNCTPNLDGCKEFTLCTIL